MARTMWIGVSVWLAMLVMVGSAFAEDVDPGAGAVTEPSMTTGEPAETEAPAVEPEPPELEPTPEQARIDALALQDLYTRHREAFRGIEGGVSIHETSIEGTLTKCEEELPRIQAVEETALPEIEPVLARVSELWGKPGAEEEAREEEGFDHGQFALRQSSEIEWNMKMAAADNDPRKARDLPEEFDRIGTHYTFLVNAAINVANTRKANGESLVTWVRDQPQITFFVQNKRVAIMTQWKSLLEWALKFDPTNVYANARLATIDTELADLQKALDKEIDAAKWLGHVEEFAGPGTVEELAQAAMEYFRNDRDWGKQGEDVPEAERGKGVQVLAVAVRDNWQVAETDIFGRVTCWRLPIHLAVTRPADKTRGIAWVYEISACTQTGAPGRTPKAPPFDGFWVGDSWMIRLNKIPH